MRLRSFLFWFCLIGASFDTLALGVTSRIPPLASSAPYLALGAFSFAMGAVANHLTLSRSRTRTK